MGRRGAAAANAAASGAIEAKIDPVQWAKFQRDLKNFEPETRKELNKKLKSLGGDMVASAKANASWSSRIPGAIRMSVGIRAVKLVTSTRRAPHARPYEGISQGATFRHPVFGNRSNWVEQSARPFLLPAVEEHREAFYEAAGAAIDEAAEQTGWK